MKLKLSIDTTQKCGSCSEILINLKFFGFLRIK